MHPHAWDETLSISWPFLIIFIWYTTYISNSCSQIRFLIHHQQTKTTLYLPYPGSCWSSVWKTNGTVMRVLDQYYRPVRSLIALDAVLWWAMIYTNVFGKTISHWTRRSRRTIEKRKRKQAQRQVQLWPRSMRLWNSYLSVFTSRSYN